LLIPFSFFISEQVADFYKRPNVESPAKAALEEASHMLENRGVQLLGQIRHGSCRPRAIFFKVLADSVGLESRLLVVSLTSSSEFNCSAPF
jgi:hypothetical protein